MLAAVSRRSRADVAAVNTDGTPGSGGPSGQENAVWGLAKALEAVTEAAQRAAERAAAGDRANTDRQLEAVANRLARVETRLAEAREALPDKLAAASDRLDQAKRRTEQADKL